MAFADSSLVDVLRGVERWSMEKDATFRSTSDGHRLDFQFDGVSMSVYHVAREYAKGFHIALDLPDVWSIDVQYLVTEGGVVGVIDHTFRGDFREFYLWYCLHKLRGEFVPVRER